MPRSSLFLVPCALLLCAGCASGPPPADLPPVRGEAEARHEPSGAWRADDPEVGSLRLTATPDGDDALECELVDARGTRFAFRAERSRGRRYVAELEPGTPGLKLLLCLPEDSLEVAGSMNYARGRLRLALEPVRRAGREVLFLRAWRPGRKAETLRALNLVRAESADAE